jgi:hypothetical protein
VCVYECAGTGMDACVHSNASGDEGVFSGGNGDIEIAEVLVWVARCAEAMVCDVDGGAGGVWVPQRLGSGV